MDKRTSIEILREPPPPEADVRIRYGEQPLQFGDLRVPAGDGPHPVVVFIHGGYWQSIYNLTPAIFASISPCIVWRAGMSSTAGSAIPEACGRHR